MALTPYRSALIAGLLALPFATSHAQVFVVGEKSATADIATDFTPTHVPLPEAKLDRFLLKLQVPYPALQDEVRLLANVQNGFESRELDKMNLEPIAAGLLEQAQQELKTVTVEEALFSYIVQIARRTRDWPSLSLGASPRAAVSLMAVAKAVAAMDGREYVIPDDVKAASRPVLRHRIILRPEADLEGITPDQVLEDVLRAVEVPK